MNIRASSLSELFDCPARWESKYIDKKFLPTSPQALLGTAVHLSTATYDYGKMKELPISPEDTIETIHETIFNPKEEVEWEDENKNEMEQDAIAMHMAYCKHITPLQKYKAIEVECEPLYIKDLDITLTGGVDRIRELSGSTGIVDLKSGKNIVSPQGEIKTKNYALQLGVYELLTEATTGEKINTPAQIIGINKPLKNGDVRINTGLIVSAKALLIGTPESPGFLGMASNLIKSGLFFGNTKSTLCNKKYCPIYTTCKWRR